MNMTHQDTLMTASEFVPRLVYLLLVVIATIFGNLLVIIAVAKFKKLRRSTNLMLASLAMADLMVGFITVPLYILWTVNPAIFDKSGFLCRLVLLSCLLFVAASQVSLLVLSLERYLAVCQPFKHRYLILHCPWIHKVAICFIWVISAIATAVSSLGIRPNYETCSYYGVFDKMFLFFAVICGIFVLFLVIIVINIKVFCSVRSHEIKLSVVADAGISEQRQSSDFCHQEAIGETSSGIPNTLYPNNVLVETDLDTEMTDLTRNDANYFFENNNNDEMTSSISVSSLWNIGEIQNYCNPNKRPAFGNSFAYNASEKGVNRKPRKRKIAWVESFNELKCKEKENETLLEFGESEEELDEASCRHNVHDQSGSVEGIKQAASLPSGVDEFTIESFEPPRRETSKSSRTKESGAGYNTVKCESNHLEETSGTHISNGFLLSQFNGNIFGTAKRLLYNDRTKSDSIINAKHFCPNVFKPRRHSLPSIKIGTANGDETCRDNSRTYSCLTAYSNLLSELKTISKIDKTYIENIGVKNERSPKKIYQHSDDGKTCDNVIGSLVRIGEDSSSTSNIETGRIEQSNDPSYKPSVDSSQPLSHERYLDLTNDLDQIKPDLNDSPKCETELSRYCEDTRSDNLRQLQYVLDANLNVKNNLDHDLSNNIFHHLQYLHLETKWFKSKLVLGSAAKVLHQLPSQNCSSIHNVIPTTHSKNSSSSCQTDSDEDDENNVDYNVNTYDSMDILQKEPLITTAYTSNEKRLFQMLSPKRHPRVSDRHPKSPKRHYNPKSQKTPTRFSNTNPRIFAHCKNNPLSNSYPSGFHQFGSLPAIVISQNSLQEFAFLENFPHPQACCSNPILNQIVMNTSAMSTQSHRDGTTKDDNSTTVNNNQVSLAPTSSPILYRNSDDEHNIENVYSNDPLNNINNNNNNINNNNNNNINNNNNNINNNNNNINAANATIETNERNKSDKLSNSEIIDKNIKNNNNNNINNNNNNNNDNNKIYQYQYTQRPNRRESNNTNKSISGLHKNSNDYSRKYSGNCRQAYVSTKVARTVTVVCASFILAWLPFFVVIVYNTFCAKCDLAYYLNAVLMVAFGQSASNPVIYALYHASFRRAYESLLKQLCSKKS